MPTLRRRLTIPAAAIALALSFALTGIGYWAGNTVVASVSSQLAAHLVDDLHHDTSTVVERCQRVLARVAADMSQNGIPLDDPGAVRRELFVELTDEPNIDWLVFGNEAGGAVEVGRQPDGTLMFLLSNGFQAGVLSQYDAAPGGQPGRLRASYAGFDARASGWYRQVKTTRRSYWTEPYAGFGWPLLRLSFSAPVFGKDGRFAGVIGVGVLLGHLEKYIPPAAIGRRERSFVIDSEGRLIISSGGVTPGAMSAGGSEQLARAVDADDPIVRGTARYLQTHPGTIAGLSGAMPRGFSFDDPAVGRTYAAAEGFQAPGGGLLTIVAAVPAAEFLAPTRAATLFSVVMSLLVVAAALGLGNWALALALQPLTALTQAARSISRGEWPELPEAQPNDEVGVLAHAFRRMVASLKDTQDGLRRSEENYRGIFENAIEGIARIAPDGHLLTANPALARMLGYASPEEMIGAQNGRAKLVWATPQACEAALATLLSQGVITGYEAELQSRDGRPVWVLLNSRMVRDGSGAPAYAETFMTDMSERKRAEEALHDARGELARASRMTALGGLTAEIAHEVNQPLAGMVNSGHACLRWLAGDTPDVEAARRSVERIISDARRAAEVISRLHGIVMKSPAPWDWVSVNEVIREVVSLAASEVDRYRVALVVELSEDLPCVKGDRTQLQQVVHNLIMNAIEAMSALSGGPRELRLGSARDGSHAVLVTVQDSGRGLEPAQLARLFDAFYTTKSAGMGLGLAISRSIVEAHGGRLWARANTPRGAIFQFTLPVEPEECAAAGTAALAAPRDLSK